MFDFVVEAHTKCVIPRVVGALANEESPVRRILKQESFRLLAADLSVKPEHETGSTIASLHQIVQWYETLATISMFCFEPVRVLQNQKVTVDVNLIPVSFSITP